MPWSRRPNRTAPGGTRPRIAEGDALITATPAHAPIGPYQLQAAIAAVHAGARSARDTDRTRILGPYELLTTLAPGPMVTLDRLVAHAMVHGPRAGLAHLATAAADPAPAGHHRVAAVRAHLLDLAGDHRAAAEQYRLAAAATSSVPERRYLESRGDRIVTPG